MAASVCEGWNIETCARYAEPTFVLSLSVTCTVGSCTASGPFEGSDGTLTEAPLVPVRPGVWEARGQRLGATCDEVPNPTNVIVSVTVLTARWSEAVDAFVADGAEVIVEILLMSGTACRDARAVWEYLATYP